MTVTKRAKSAEMRGTRRGRAGLAFVVSMVTGTITQAVVFAQTPSPADAHPQPGAAVASPPAAGSSDASRAQPPAVEVTGSGRPVEAAAPVPAAAAAVSGAGESALPVAIRPEEQAGPVAQAAAVPEQPAPAQLKAVVVTAERREETAQQVPTAISVVSGDKLVDSGVGRSAGEVLNSVPSASAATQLHGRPRWWIRGVGTGQQQLDFSNPVGFYLDDVYISNATATGFPLFDLDRVEVLRGPQGTLWGKNTTGGSVNIVTRRPTFAPADGYLKLDYGTFNDKLVEGASNGVVWAKRLAARSAFHYESRDGRFTNLYDLRKGGEFQDGAFRLQLLANVADDVEALVNLHLRKYTAAGAIATVSSRAPDGVYLNGYIPSTDLSSVNSNAPTSEDIRQTGASLTLKGQSHGFTLTAISGFEEYRGTSQSDGDNTPLEISRGWTDAVSRQYSQEFRLNTPKSDLWSGVAGLFYFYEDIKSKSASGRLPGGNAIGAPNYALQRFEHTNSSFAPFASATVRVTKALSVKAGIRWTWEHRELDVSRIANAGTPVFADTVNWWNPASLTSPLQEVYAATPSKSWTNFTYDVTPSYSLTPDASIYFRYAFGVKSGGYNTAATTRAALNVVEPEKLTAYEAGAKTSWLNRRLTANASAYYYDYRDVQINVVGPLPPTNVAVSYLQNAQKARNIGGELEVEALPAKCLHIAGNLGLLDAKFTEFRTLFGGQDYSGNRLVRAPKVSSMLRAELTLPASSRLNVIVGGDWRFQSKQYFYTTGQNDPLLGQGAYSLINARVTFQSVDEKVALVFYANNALDVRYKNHALPGAANAAGHTTMWADPRTVGVSLISRWW